jgi:hypothetical protein
MSRKKTVPARFSVQLERSKAHSANLAAPHGHSFVGVSLRTLRAGVPSFRSGVCNLRASVLVMV